MPVRLVVGELPDRVPGLTRALMGWQVVGEPKALLGRAVDAGSLANQALGLIARFDLDIVVAVLRPSCCDLSVM
jgi:hypothetical protein